MYKHAKLSTIWFRAEKELEQVRGGFGNLHKKQACAMGAICYYLSEGERLTPFFLAPKDQQWYETNVRRFGKRTGKSVLEWNDLENKTFKELGSMARKVGM